MGIVIQAVRFRYNNCPVAIRFYNSKNPENNIYEVVEDYFAAGIRAIVAQLLPAADIN